MRNILLFCIVLFFVSPANADQHNHKEYYPGGAVFTETWKKFYAGDHEPELDDPLIEAGKRMTLVICEAIKNKDMRLRRYAIGALGYIGDKRAIPTLEQILESKEEIYYFRGDALHAIYQLDKKLGKQYAKQYGSAHKYLSDLQKSIENDESWLTEPTGLMHMYNKSLDNRRAKNRARLSSIVMQRIK
jgi:hypothetical protein